MNGANLALGAAALFALPVLFSKKGSAATRDVALAWCRGEAAGCAGSLCTDGLRLMSYQLPIGVTKGNRKILIDYSARCDASQSVTTSKHVSYARQCADEVYCPPWPPPSIRDIVDRPGRY
jgi:hypothetical protein